MHSRAHVLTSPRMLMTIMAAILVLAVVDAVFRVVLDAQWSRNERWIRILLVMYTNLF